MDRFVAVRFPCLLPCCLPMQEDFVEIQYTILAKNWEGDFKSFQCENSSTRKLHAVLARICVLEKQWGDPFESEKLKKVFAEWIDNGHIDLDDENTIILCIKLTDGQLLSHGTRYEL